MDELTDFGGNPPSHGDVLTWDGDAQTWRPLALPGGGTGEDGASAYDIAVEEGFSGTVDEWLESLVGEQGPKGDQGDAGAAGSAGADGEGFPSGWHDVSSESWVYSSSDGAIGVVTVPNDYTTKVSPGWRVKLTQTTVKKFIVVGVTATTLTLFGGTDYTLTDAAISSMAISPMKAPLGFDPSPSKWTIPVTDTTQVAKSSPVQNTWYRLSGQPSIVLPVGAWLVSYVASIQCVGVNAATANSIANQMTTLSTSATAESDAEMTRWHFIQEIIGSSSATLTENIIFPHEHPGKVITVATPTTYYLIGRTTSASITSINWRGDVATTTIRAVCAYL